MGEACQSLRDYDDGDNIFEFDKPKRANPAPVSINFTDEERGIIADCHTPERTQEFLDSLDYNFEADGVATLRSFRRIVRDRTAHCIEGALSAATILGQHGHRPRLLCMEARDIDHIIFPFQERDRWGSIAQSRDPNLKGREPKYKTVRDLAHSYHPHYWNYHTGDRNDLTLRGFALFQLSRIKEDWQTAEEDLWFLDDMLYKPRYQALFPEPGKTHFRANRDESITWLK